MQSVNIISKENGAGLSRNIRLLSDILGAAGWLVHATLVTEKDLFRSELRAGRRAESWRNTALAGARNWWEARCAWRRTFDVNLFMESLLPQWFPRARFNCLIPNPEWFETRWCEYLSKIDIVLCKTRHAERIFAALGTKTAFTSFTSLDRFQPTIQRDERAFLHLAGTSKQKGTAPLVKLWQRHPEWPTLTVVQHPTNAQPVSASNIDLRAERLDDAALQELQNRHGVHVCPSEAEGFGHYLVEAMSCRALSITTNAPPMNEHISLERGLLARYAATEPQRMAVNYYVDLVSLEEQIERAIEMPRGRWAELCQNARDWFETNDRFFRSRIIAQLEQLLNGAREAA
jgi:hypothetical protein